MTLADVDPNITRPSSRSSNLSGVNKLARNPSNASTADVLSAASGIHSMLRTTTELGDLDALPPSSRRLPKAHVMPARRLNRLPPGLAPSRTSSHYSREGSIRSLRSARSVQDPSMPGAWPYSHRNHPGSQDYNTAHSDTRSSAAQESIRSMPVGVPEYAERSDSLTGSIPPAFALTSHPSMTSLRSPNGIGRPPTPYAQPSRFHPPGYRPSSPAMSDNAASMNMNGYPRSRRPYPGPPSHAASPMPLRGPMEPAYRPMPPFHPPPARTSRPSDDMRRPFPRQPMYADYPQDHSGMGIPDPRSPLSPNGAFMQSYGPDVARFRRGAPPKPMPGRNQMRSPPPPPPPRPGDQAPYRGFVQRVKHVLEERISNEDLTQPSHDQFASPVPYEDQTQLNGNGSSPADLSEQEAFLEDSDVASCKSTSSTPQALQADSQSVRRLTRDMVKSIVGPGSASSEGINEATDPAYVAGVNSMKTDEADLVDTAEDDPSDPISNQEPPLLLLKNVSDRASEDLPAQVDHPEDQDAAYSADEEVSAGTDLIAQATEVPVISGTRTLSIKPETVSSPASYHANATPFLERPKSQPFDTATRQKRALSDGSTRSLPLQESLVQSTTPTVSAKQVVDQKMNNDPDRSPNHSNKASDSTCVDRPESLNFGDKLEAHVAQPVSNARASSVTLPDEELQALRQSKASEVDAQDSWQRPPSVNSTTPGSAPDQLPIRSSSLRAYLIDRPPSTSPGLLTPSAHNEHKTSAMKNFQFPLPDLTEDSQEDSSTTNLRMLGARKSGLQHRIRKEHRRKARIPPRGVSLASSAQSYFSRSPATTHNLPSLNFSRHDLTETLNDALGLRQSKSLENICTVPLESPREEESNSRPVSSTFVQDERYKSFFALSGQPPTDFDTPLRVRVSSSINEELLGEIERLSIPSVKDLTMRLSRLIPSMQRERSDMDLSLVDNALNETVDEIRELGSPERLASMDLENDTCLPGIDELAFARNPTVGSAGSRALTCKQASQNHRPYLRLMKDLPPLPADDEEDREDKRRQKKRRFVSPSPDRVQNESVLCELEGSSVPANGPCREQEVDSQSAAKFKLKKSFLSLREPSGAARPWNNQENYPWSSSAPTIDISLSPKPGKKDEGLETPSRLRLKPSKSNPDLSAADGIRIARSMSPGFKFNGSLIPRSEIFSEDGRQDGGSKGIFGSISRKMGLSPRIDKSGFPIDPNFLHPEERPVDPGDRYPTTGLLAPAGLNIDESRSFFSEDSSEAEQVRGIRKRMTRLRALSSRLGPPTPEPRREDPHRSESGIDRTMSNESRHDDEQSNIFQQEPAPAGLSRREFHAKRIVEILRMIWFRSGELVRRGMPKQKKAGEKKTAQEQDRPAI